MQNREQDFDMQGYKYKVERKALSTIEFESADGGHGYENENSKIEKISIINLDGRHNYYFIKQYSFCIGII